MSYELGQALGSGGGKDGSATPPTYTMWQPVYMKTLTGTLTYINGYTGTYKLDLYGSVPVSSLTNIAQREAGLTHLKVEIKLNRTYDVWYNNLGGAGYTATFDNLDADLGAWLNNQAQQEIEVYLISDDGSGQGTLTISSTGIKVIYQGGSGIYHTII